MRFRASLATVLFALATSSMLRAGGVGREEQSAKAAAMAEAFVAQADDPSAVTYNPAGLAFAEDRAFSTGFTLGLSSSNHFTGLDPVPGAGMKGQRRIDQKPLPHLFWTEPVARRWAIGIGLNGGAAFDSIWKGGDQWSGRFESRRSRLQAWDLSAVAALRVHEHVGLSVGVITRLTDFSWSRDETGLNPATQMDEPIGSSMLEADATLGIGAVVGLLYQPSGRWSLGLRWRSEIAARLDGRATFTQVLTGDPTFDSLAAGLRPFGQSLIWRATVRFPESLVVGASYSLTPTARLEVDLEQTDWSPFNHTVFRIQGQAGLDRRPLSGWETRIATRIGLRWNGLGNGEWRAGLFRDPTAQPSANLGPFFVGANRWGGSVGFGTRVQRLQTDLALVWEQHEDRATRSHGFDGRYSTRLIRMVLTFGW